MQEEFIQVNGPNGEIYEVLPTTALLDFLQRLAADEGTKQETQANAQDLTDNKETCVQAH